MTSDNAENGAVSSDSLTWELVMPTSRQLLEPPPRQKQIGAALKLWLAPFKPGTVTLYLSSLRDLGKWMDVAPVEPEIAGMLLELDAARVRVVLEQWISSSRGRCADTTLKSRLSAILCWLRWAQEHGLGGPGAVQVRHSLVTDTPSVDLIDVSKVQDKLHALLKSQKTGDIRDGFIVAFLAITGVRRSELSNIQLEHFTGPAHQVKCRIVRKGRAIDAIVIPRPLGELLGRWLERVPWAPEKQGPLLGGLDRSRQWVNKRGLGAHAIYGITKRLGLGSPHALRRMAGSWAIQFGHHGRPADMESLRGFLGHRSLEATHRYTRRAGDSGRDIRHGMAVKLLSSQSEES